ncbi:vascular endothelial zinc finger 1, partial [Colletes latitarsis]|uniref:vascular endothelial zinc finger 1 n=1 Tax=Colletes latitarsis TaxID=2605962 RepID=UPI00403690F1
LCLPAPRLTVKNIDHLGYKRRPIIHKCVRCGKCYQLLTSLKRHLRLECGVEPRQCCWICGRKFTHKFRLTQHVTSCGKSRRKTAIDGEEQASNERISLVSGLLATMLLSQDIHQPLDNSDALWSQLCYSAGSPYKPNRSQRGKEPKETEPKYVCNRCGKTYKATTSLSRHKRLECGVVPCEVCPICDRRFKHRFVLNSHIVGCQRKLRHIMEKSDDTSVYTEKRD